MTQKVIKIGTSAAVVIPKEMLKDLQIKVGDSVALEVNKDRTVKIKPMGGRTPNRNERIAKLTLDFIDRYRNDLEALAKK
ncbi:MAG: hypothetical protein UW74_C0034G0003 [Candidatus Giovannonibacteria bacterium GW2011_GWC2_44_8]|uniref:SpoVT-AbrB domain-containing protein n=4 Tax=Candidatus Giovannoniibacteriota TaxID=1752738 RepID=A0A1F5XBX9_9BACT|nr:MAG: hypothetical protein UW74_C0034G0003 [Candidatus Giovannonibacteria bacterium GW2011_GWC2_44_8]OGF74340.1 MAG: hypothetical protein A2W57_03260 [Candidatus Giovannonibacteria bacterium RIFCSPHIGHO2_02_43_16]OGF85404.1 MAG: hypothetical protein A2Z63_02100 [Candidatus Giovannonibacteria bacterium RIFCSPLOWO2_02_44_8]OGF94681.1 MAG: hypothetical protein A2Y47_00705 [Candidatus Giovannonibacteria bacterium RIFCSPLOWO2_12_43_8]